MPPSPIAQPTEQEVRLIQAAQKQAHAEQLQLQMNLQFQAEMRALSHELYAHLIKGLIDKHGVDSVTMEDCRQFAKRAEQFSPFVLEKMGLCKVHDWPKPE